MLKCFKLKLGKLKNSFKKVKFVKLIIFTGLKNLKYSSWN